MSERLAPCPRLARLSANVPKARAAPKGTSLERELRAILVEAARDGNALGRALAHLGEAAARRNAHVVVGGRAIMNLPLLPAQNLYVGSSMGELAGFARGLRASAAIPVESDAIA